MELSVHMHQILVIVGQLQIPTVMQSLWILWKKKLSARSLFCSQVNIYVDRKNFYMVQVVYM